MEYLNENQPEILSIAQSKASTYAQAKPFPNIYLDNFFNPELLEKVLGEFPDLKKKPELSYNDLNQVKRAANKESSFGPTTKALLHYLNSAPFLDFLSALTGIEHLIPDPYFLGGGFHEILPGGFLKVHADFNKHQGNKLDRRLNVLIYLNKDWEESFGGHFQLWDKEMRSCQTSILPVFNRMAIFSTTDFSYHGHPDPLTCPPDRSRKSLALYYYTNGRPEEEISTEEHSTLFQYRPGLDDKVKKLDKIQKTLEAITPPFIYFRMKKLWQKK